MKYDKMLLAALAVMLVFAIAPMASAGTGTYNDPYTVLYVGYSYEEGLYTDMVGAPMPTTGINSSISKNSGVTIYYNTSYTSIDYDNNYLPIPASLYSSADAVTNAAGYDYLIVDMAYTGYSYGDEDIDDAREFFYDVTNASNITHKASIYSNDVFGSYAPDSFNYRDTLAYSTTNPTFFTGRINTGLNVIGFGTSVDDYKVLLSYLNS